ncbi:glycine dehydrogenase subunit 2 [Legionella taurinensis]|uniref:Probable glycine dehydrogenase (decarboxylating) subunit 2 n=1 Tax=Legionella taurinensis TaxID=70611 RepID=A0A3A5L1U5_9GAMM|nr:aminomethyl-transferring glycine dehydrogenase subunit GcvPB [Legionella taurinensis]MDX1836082.1 aminomethyl-transferring glycine dehydrogenase subunit GcvPB [Legionella taurinensis]PUT42142.1 aminomethyl-transferring glycine dehydrogenase subunit GcvPB [Legionella taurinensis]PUT44929.1 aminomethyl-transferring glycine dehydrogenase subunit GcvPB [Legionella taurinensis]PUT48251.1 aminomethyl-transferring glycine dehydrogenase subunit GcvPB [Legionella taurinensis]PUT49064.1 aminomethyl-t
MLIFERSQTNRQATAQAPGPQQPAQDIPARFLRKHLPRFPSCSELQVVRHYTRLSQKNFSIDTHFYPLGSCTMKYNPRGVHKAATLPGFNDRHPLAPAENSQGFLQALHELQSYIAEITGMPGVSLTPMAGSQGEFAGVAMIKAYHQSRGDTARDEILIPEAAHGTNPASAAMCGFKVVEIETSKDGDIDLEVLKSKVGPRTAGIMLTNPSTLGLFMRQIKDIAAIIHQAGGLLYYDGANLNAILGKVRPGDMGFDVMHLNLHKTFATPHGGGGPGAGPVAVGKRLLPYLPLPIVMKEQDQYRWATRADYPQSIGRLSTFMGNAGILLRAYFYTRILGKEGLSEVAELATLNANYLLASLTKAGFQAAYPGRRASHEFILTLNQEKKNFGITAMDLAKRLLDYGFHAPTTYFPLLVPECLLIEPTETECRAELDSFIAAMQAIRDEAQKNPELVRNAPHTMPVKRLDDVRAARELDLNFYSREN